MSPGMKLLFARLMTITIRFFRAIHIGPLRRSNGLTHYTFRYLAPQTDDRRDQADT